MSLLQVAFLDQVAWGVFSMEKIGRTSVSLETREAFQNGHRLRIGARAFDMLEVLIQARGKIVTKNQIMSHVWPDLVVEEGNIHVHLSALRKQLGADGRAIQTVPRRGYRLVPLDDDTSVHQSKNSAIPSTSPSIEFEPLPICYTPLIGRENEIGEITSALQDTPVVTLLGPGGAGKTHLAIEAAQSMRANGRVDVCFLSLAPVLRREQVLNAAAEAFGIEPFDELLLLPKLLGAVADRRILLVLDNCEHMLEEAARLTERLVQASANLRVLATSREALRSRNETLHWVAPLATPGVDATHREILACPSVETFLAFAASWTSDLTKEPENVDMIGSVCRQLDGLPLALELAASRARVFGMRQLACEVADDPFRTLIGGRRTAPARQRTLLGMLDWSYQLLGELERVVLHKLAKISGHFHLDHAQTVAAVDRVSKGDVTEAIAGLVSKCLVIRTPGGEKDDYYLLGTTREYALRKLDRPPKIGEGPLERTRHRDRSAEGRSTARASTHFASPGNGRRHRA
ncbi:winged helix-turn-helix domain-containing protein [Paraburkholderia sp. BL23I1N1]|uniref:ATP-binding protein n=1 Tax=Paraburkholderia sp. BL23I1N1 TaxID=1938802 RepID=UPI0015FF71B5|nr:winged helix-turn-helix domain-containing protein [Paraburkholderia sp. BL23I1N1]